MPSGLLRRDVISLSDHRDDIFPEGAAAHAMTLSTRPVWNLYGVEDRLQSMLEPGPHDISSQAKEQIYIWLDRILQRNRKESYREIFSLDFRVDRCSKRSRGRVVGKGNPYGGGRQTRSIAKRLVAPRDAIKNGEYFTISSMEPSGGKMIVRRETRTRSRTPQDMIVWILDDDGDMPPDASQGDTDSDCYVADYGCDGKVDRMVDYIDADGDQIPDEMEIRSFVDGECGVLGSERIWMGREDVEYRRLRIPWRFFFVRSLWKQRNYMNKYHPQRDCWIPISECPFSFTIRTAMENRKPWFVSARLRWIFLPKAIPITPTAKSGTKAISIHPWSGWGRQYPL
jgi:hypothetical protein